MAELSNKLINLIRRLDEQCTKEGIDPHEALNIYKSHPEYSNIHDSYDSETYKMMYDMDSVEKFLDKLPHLLDDGK